MDSVDQQTGVMDGSYCGEKRKRGRPRKYGPLGSVEHTFSPSPIAGSPPPGFFKTYQAASSRGVVFPVGNHTPPSTGFVSADGSQDRPLNSVGLENLASGAEHNLRVCPDPEIEYMINMEIEENTARQAQREMRRFTSTITELCTGFETAKKKNEDLVKQVTNLEGQIQKWKDQKASWDETKKELEMERDEARKEALFAVSEKRDIEEKLEKAAKQVDDAKTSAKKAIYEAVVLTTRSYKNFLGNLVASLANCEGESLKDGAKELIKEILCDDRALADEAVHVAGHSFDDTIKDKAP